ncbi:MAG: hypothetical protein JJU36_15250 [Phycisphaeraceae bacterium]|nr:hypothetical protein [Phycisphaeraceae bacterium]
MNEHTMPEELLDLMESLLEQEDRSPLRLVESVRPYLTPRTVRLWRDMRDMAAHAVRSRMAVVTMLDRLGRTPPEKAYASEVQLAGYLNLEKLVPGTIDQLAEEVRLLEEINAQSQGHPDIARVTDRLLDVRRRNLDCLRAHARGLGPDAQSAVLAKPLKPGDNPAQHI